MARIFTGRKSGFIQRSGVARRETVWIGSASFSTLLSAPSTAVLQASLNAAALALRPFTVVRTRGFFHLRSDQGAVTEIYEAALGLAVVSDQAVAIGVTAVPTPTTDDDSDLWFVYERGFGELEVNTSVGFSNGPAGGYRSFDSKAMRKVEDGQDVIQVVETSALSSGARLASHLRMLVKLH